MTADDVRAAGLAPGLAVHLEFPGTEAAPIHTRVRDMVIGEYVELLVARAVLQDTLCAPGVPWLMLYVAEHAAVAASTSFLAHVPHPREGVRVAFPRRLSAHAARVYKRMSTGQAVRYSVLHVEHPESATWVETVFHDLSLGGCALRTAEALAHDARVCVELPVHLDGAPVQVEGSIRRCVEGEKDFLVSLQFDDLDQRQRSALVHLLGPDGLAADPLVIADD